jgi:hypothetical protein
MDQDQDSDDIPGATDMTRQVSSNPHATRGATRSAFNPSASAIANGHMPFIYNPPFVLDAKIFQKANAAAPTPPALSASDVDQDLKLMLRDAPLDDAVNEITSHVRSVVPELEVGRGLVNGMGGVPMSAQSSMAGWSDAGGNTPLGRFGDSAGAVPMARTSSGRGRGRGRG